MKHPFLVNLSLRQNCQDQAGDESLGPSRSRLPRQRYSRLCSLSLSLFRFLHFSFLPHKCLIPGTRLSDLTPVTSHPGPSGNTQRHFFLRNLTEEEGGEEVGGASEAGRAELWGKRRAAEPASFLRLGMGGAGRGVRPSCPLQDSSASPRGRACPFPRRWWSRARTPAPMVPGLGPEGLFPSSPLLRLCPEFSSKLAGD